MCYLYEPEIVLSVPSDEMPLDPALLDENNTPDDGLYLQMEEIFAIIEEFLNFLQLFIIFTLIFILNKRADL